MSLTRRSLLAGGLAATACASLPDQTDAGVVDVFDPAMVEAIDPAARFDVLGEGYTWSEGPAWDRERGALYFTDVPSNVAYRWRPGHGVDPFLAPSGAADVEGFREPGANGLWYGRGGDLIVCNHGRRAVERMDIATRTRQIVVGTYEGRPFNSPNDVVEAADGTLYFTDPPYGLEGMNASPLKAQSANGVYRLRPGGEPELLIRDMTFPNGVALSPDERTLYVSQSDPDAPLIRALAFDVNGATMTDHIVFDASSYMGEASPGLPDGLAMCAGGQFFATGPGGVFLLGADGTPLGRIRTGAATANCAFGEDGRTLFITAHDRLLKIRTRMLGVQWS